MLYRLGVLLREVQDGRLWEAAGFVSYPAWLQDDAQISRTTAHRAVTIARHFNEDMAVRYGMEKLYQGLRYLDLTGREEQPGDLVALDLRLRDDRGRYVSVPFHEATQRQVQQAVALLTERRARRWDDADLAGRLSRLDAALPDPPAGVRKVQDRVVVTHGKDGEVALDFRRIPLKDLDQFIAALQDLQRAQGTLDDEDDGEA